jgi:hypothetical protein
MNSTCSTRRTRVSADGDGVVLHAGAAPLRETADYTGLVAAVTAALADTYRGPWLHAPGRVFVDLAVAVAVDPVDRRLGERTTAATATGTLELVLGRGTASGAVRGGERPAHYGGWIPMLADVGPRRIWAAPGDRGPCVP